MHSSGEEHVLLTPDKQKKHHYVPVFEVDILIEVHLVKLKVSKSCHI